MIPHSDLVHFVVELYASQGVAPAKPLSECGQGLPVYAAGNEIRTGEEGLATFDWGNATFVSAARKVAKGILVGASERSESDVGGGVESTFNFSFWAKEGAIAKGSSSFEYVPSMVSRAASNNVWR